MVDPTVLPGYMAVILLFLAPPGPDMAYMLAVGLEGGRRSAVKAILGIGTGMSVYAAAVVAGMGEIARSYPLILDTVRILGAAYLLWLAYATMRHARRAIGGHSDVTAGRGYLRGVFVSITNPKIILFFLAVLPQFIGSADNPALQMAMLGAVNVLMEVILYGCIGVLAGVFHARLVGSTKATAVLNYIACIVYVVLAGTIFGEILLS
ncbi:Threonine/homoserine/homoserine lactone efflux protein [Streptomyces sp. Ag82_O1-12]|uniref:LysE family translocator n=1 Tax=unclassified Streptomyces TaxID=2593676 RepID=UPI000BD3F079|nr:MULTISPECIES: LysE family translocator [unclassified Streptomyces]SMQ18082.1 Threonine/homoserine/homoserine lactone efflux protein [Streptomyces sp. Ag82_O1-12]SOD47119.1 Threonine/homoserine/homoserine lactone efflux protein [Streptomyces sp. Ag82_G6-1]